MRGVIDKEKKAIRDLSVFEGLAVDDPIKFRNLFLQPQFILLEFENEENLKSHVIFEEHQGVFVFHLVNFTKLPTVTMTEDFINGHVIPFCQARGLSFVQARAERKGMEVKLKKMGFVPHGDVLRLEVNNVS